MEIDKDELATLIRASHSISAAIERTADQLGDVIEVLERIERKLGGPAGEG